ncbi:A disintegrin and metalloproteinase with thrombospondin motifs adt-2-like, partial [Lytechinus pictus]|uniref:A disintegrin and metalloproteinase with thrombospondin motifs adt-2-like n=1 Tax=Lytechinus pictus TaxID=7653 RepID=UPI0030BA0AB7
MAETHLGTAITSGCPGKGERMLTCEGEPCPTQGPPQIEGFMDWQDWKEWSHCPGKCSQRLRYRDCNEYGQRMAVGCRGKHVEIQNCGIPSCPKMKKEAETSRTKEIDDIFWSQWDPWTPCGRTCGGGKMYRKRVCHKMRPPHAMVAYHDCGAHDVEDRKCNTQLCPGQKPKPKKVFMGTWTPWAPWFKCSTKCAGGTKERYRTCLGKAGEELGIAECVGGDIQYGDCGDPKCKPKPHVWKPKPAVKKKMAQWTEWETWLKCDKKCGPGERDRWRECMAGEKYRKQEECGDPNGYKELEPCYLKPCEEIIRAGVEWTPWKEWSDCNCDDGTRERYRICQYETSKEYTLGCRGEYKDTSSCSSTSCGGQGGSLSMPRTGAGAAPGRTDKSNVQHKNNPPKQSSSRPDVKAWSTWNDWSTCTATCGKGTRSRWRQCEGPDQSLAAGCVGEYMDFSDCESQPCQSASRSGSSQGSSSGSSQVLPSGSNQGSRLDSSQGSRFGSNQGLPSGSSQG